MTEPKKSKKTTAEKQDCPPPLPWPVEFAKEAFQKALNEAAKNLEFRDRCMASSRSAKEAITEISGAQIPDDVEICFYPREELDYLFIVKVPEYTPEEEEPNLDVSDHVLCTWPQYKRKELNEKKP